MQPWERSSAGITQGSAFTAGRDSFITSLQGASASGETLQLQAAGSGPAWGIWRIGLDGGQPGTLSADVNVGAGEGGGYYLAVANYGSGRWQWHGPFMDSHVRLSLAGGSSLASPAGNLLVAVLVDGQHSAEVVGLGVEMADPADGSPPGQVSGLQATAVAGGLLLQWNPLQESGIAGYRIYHSGSPFTNPQAAGVRSVSYLEGNNRHLLDGIDGTTFVRVAAVDHSGNTGEASEQVSGLPLAGAAVPLALQLDHASGTMGFPATLVASGADNYDFDAEGDGIFEVLDSSSGSIIIDTMHPGIIRPAVLAHGPGGEAVALGSVSLLVSANSRPLASATASPQTGPAPLLVDFNGVAEDQEDAPQDLVLAWDFDGDGIYEPGTDTLNPPAQLFKQPGIHNVKFRVSDSQGASDVDSVAILVTGIDPDNIAPFADIIAKRTPGISLLQVDFDASNSFDSDGSVVWYEWDLDGDGSFELAGPGSHCSHVFPLSGIYHPLVRVTDDAGETGSMSTTLHLPSAWPDLNGGQLMQRRSELSGPITDNLRWSYPTGHTVSGSPVVCPDGSIVFGDYSFELNAVWPDGTLKWSLFLGGGQIESTPAVAADGTIYVTSLSDKLYAVSPSGQERWSIDTGADIISSPVVGRDGRIYFGSHNGSLYCASPEGQTIWTYPSSGIIETAPRIGPDGCVYFGNNDKRIIAVNPDGTLRWEYIATGSIRSTPAITEDGRLYIGVVSGELLCLDLQGNYLWDVSLPDAVIDSPAIGLDGKVYIGCVDDRLYAYSGDGDELWNFDTSGDIWGSPVIGSSGLVYIGSNSLDMFALDSQTGNVEWSRTLTDQIFSSACLSEDGALYITSSDGQLHSIGKAF
ncbi:MAG: PQQ-binding-like beta-propeller repeat protein [Planctomycetales bacterium]|nr:MAG: PQQ-binding-like beta-propeller repeat protein [Planctomycetales bacterium]